MRDWLENPGIPKVIYILSHFLTYCMNSLFQINQNCLINPILLEILENSQIEFKGSLSRSKNENKLDKDLHCTLEREVLIRLIQRNQGHRDSMMDEFSSSVNKVNKAVAKVRTIGDRLPLRCFRNFRNSIPALIHSILARNELYSDNFKAKKQMNSTNLGILCGHY